MIKKEEQAVREGKEWRRNGKRENGMGSERRVRNERRIKGKAWKRRITYGEREGRRRGGRKWREGGKEEVNERKKSRETKRGEAGREETRKWREEESA